MKIVFRCDASPDIGLGHLIRCLAVAKELQSQHQIIFATIKDGTNSHIKDNGFEMFFKEKDETEEAFLIRINAVLKPEVIVIDKKYPYSIDCLKEFKQNNIKIIMIDNVCEGLSGCDEIIFPNAHLDKSILKKYLSEKRINQVKIGPEYVILRNDILALKEKIDYNLHNPPNIVVNTGGTDPEGVLLKLIPWLKEMKLKANILILIGQAFKYKNELEKSIYEMIYLQIPTICISHSRENAKSAKILKERYGVIEDVGFIKNLTPQNLYLVIKKLLENKTYYKKIVKKCSNLIDGKGVKRISNVIMGENAKP